MAKRPSTHHVMPAALFATALPGALPVALLLFASLGPLLPGQSPPTIVRGSGPGGHVQCMPNNTSSLASLPDLSVWVVVYVQDSKGQNGHLSLARSTDHGQTWAVSWPLPHNSGHRVHDWNSGTIVAGRLCNVLHVAWADRSVGGTYRSAYYQAFDVIQGKWVGTSTTLAAANAAAQQEFWTTDICITPRGTVAVSIAAGANGGGGLGSWDCGLEIKKFGQTAFGAMLPLRNGGLPMSRDACIAASDEVIHCCMKNSKGGGGIAYRSFDTLAMKWQQAQQVQVGPNDNGVFPISGINAGNKSIIAADSKGGLYILYVTDSKAGLTNNNTMRLAYAMPGTGSKNADWLNILIQPHDPALGKNPRSVPATDPAYPKLQGGDTTYYNYTLAPGFPAGPDAMLVVYSKPKEDFQNKYIQLYQHGVNLPIPTKEFLFWQDTEPYIFERLSATRNIAYAGNPAWVVCGKNDKPVAGQAPFGWVRLWALTYSFARSIAFGTGCRASLPKAPRLHAFAGFASLARILPYKLIFDRLPASASFFLVAGNSCSNPPLNLGFMGAPTCSLDINFPAIFLLGADPQGQATLSWQIPNNLSLIGAYFYTQAFVLAPGANSAGAVTSNALLTVISQ